MFKKPSKFIEGENLYRKLLKLKEEADCNEDDLSFLLKMVRWIRIYKSLLMIVIFMFILITWGMLQFIFDLIVTFDSKLLTKYGGHAAIQVFSLACIGNAVTIGGRVAEYGSNFQRKLLPLRFAKKRSYKKILLDIKHLKAAVYFDIVCVLIGVGIFAVDSSFNENKVYFFIVIKRIPSPLLGRILFIVYRFSYFVVAFLSLEGAFITCYIAYHAKFQLIIVKDFMEHICDGHYGEEELQYYDKKYQKLIAERLKICFMLYQLIYSEVKDYMGIIYNSTLILLIGVLFLGGGIMIDVFSESDIYTPFAAVFLLSISGFLNSCLSSVSGQWIKDQSEDLRFKLMELPWYNMNTNNKLILYVFLMRTQNFVEFDIKLVQIDFTLVVRIFRGLYSLSTIISQSMGAKNNK